MKALKLSLLVAAGLAMSNQATFAQGQNLEQMLDSLDRPSVWQNAPAVRAQPQYAPQGGMTGGQSASPYGGAMGRNPWSTPAPVNQMPQQGMFQHPQPLGGQAMPAQMGGSSPFSKQNLLRTFMGGSPAASPTPAMSGNPFSKQNLLREFFGGGSGSGSSNPAATGDAQANLQTALNEAAQAESDAERARYGSDKGARLSAASSAQYHAGAARAAADRAGSISYSGPSLARDYAAQARDAANRAQAAADRAQYNANVN